jgi:hypothetical protein
MLFGCNPETPDHHDRNQQESSTGKQAVGKLNLHGYVRGLGKDLTVT